VKFQEQVNMILNYLHSMDFISLLYTNIAED